MYVKQLKEDLVEVGLEYICQTEQKNSFSWKEDAVL
jgi:hypothetical protein